MPKWGIGSWNCLRHDRESLKKHFVEANIPSGAKARIHFDAFAARLKSCPFKAASFQAFAARLKSCPFKAASFQGG
jgi:hypothetical protein